MASTCSIFTSLASKNLLLLSKPQTRFYSLSISKPTSTLQFSLSKPFYSFSSFRFARNVAVSSEFDQDEDDVSGPGPGPEPEPEPEFSPELKVFVGNLPFSVDSAQLAELFGHVGVVQMVEVIYDKVTGRSRGFGFVTMSTVEEVEAASQKFNGYEFEGRQLRVNAGPPPPRDSAPRINRGGSSFGNGNRVHVGNLSWKVDDSALKALFSEVGDVLEARVIYDRDSGRSKGFGFVTYSSAEDVNNAIESLDGVDFNGRNIRVSVAESRQRPRF